jgi:hypothetical protein
MGSRAAKRHQPGDLFKFLKSGVAFKPTPDQDGSFRLWSQVVIPDGTCGIVIALSKLDTSTGYKDDPEYWEYEKQNSWTPCLICGEQLWIPSLESITKRLNRRSP